MIHACISACVEKRAMGMKNITCATCKINKLIDAAIYAFAFLDSTEWTDNTSETQAENAKEYLQQAITFAEEL